MSSKTRKPFEYDLLTSADLNAICKALSEHMVPVADIKYFVLCPCGHDYYILKDGRFFR